MTGVLIKRKEGTETHEERILCDNRDSDWSDAAASGGMARIVGQYQKLRSNKKGFYPESHRKHGSADILVLDF